MDDDERVVRAAWSAVGGDRAGADDLVHRHREPHRRYHTVAHVAWVLRRLDDLALDRVDDADAVRAAALFHDAVYDPRAADNEARSAELATAALTSLGWSTRRVDVVARLILATARHDASDDVEAVLLDADLSILGSSRNHYQRYVDAVREEYAHVTDDAWRSGRASVLRGFLGRDRIYATEVGRDRFERSARENLAAELATLES